MTTPETEFINILGTSSGSSDTATFRAAKSLPEVLPILGLSDIVIYPGIVAPLLVDTAQSIRLIDDVVSGDRLLGLVLQRNADVENPLPKDLHSHGCAARILKMLKFPDNTVRVLIEGL
ncbi:MAG TPA: LON peptidase substrate-binding domain-containing protein, partial [Methylomirabilota bacterium]|nr:LON peptidase substrate-binding domain-containing protein [Methylomirabilota bacterium]